MKLVAFLAVLLAYFCPIARSADLTGKKAPGFKLQAIDGRAVSLAQLNRNSTVILSFFDTSCKPCLKELVHLKSLYNRYLKTDSVKIRMISLDSDMDTLRGYIKEHDLDIPVLRDPGGWKAAINYGVVKNARAEIPQLFIVGPDGKIKRHLKGYNEDLEDIAVKTVEGMEKFLPAASAGKKTVTLLYTGSANGYIESCNCPENPFGGLVRRMTAIKRLRKEYPGAVLVDSGDNFAVRENPLLADYVIKMMGMMDYDAIAIGDQEFIMGEDFFLDRIGELPFLAANISACDDEKCWDIAPAYTIKETGGVRVGIIGATSPDVFFLFPEDKVKGVKIGDYVQAVDTIAENMRGRADVVVLLSHAGDEFDRKAAEQLENIDVIVGGHSQTLHKEPVKKGGVIIVQAGKNGERVGRLTLELDKDKKIAGYTYDMILLVKDIPDDAEGRRLVDEYKEKLKESAREILIK